MNRASIFAVEALASRVMGLCADARAELSAANREYYITGSKTSGALRRASLDLTRSLAQMRKP